VSRCAMGLDSSIGGPEGGTVLPLRVADFGSRVAEQRSHELHQCLRLVTGNDVIHSVTGTAVLWGKKNGGGRRIPTLYAADELGAVSPVVHFSRDDDSVHSWKQVKQFIGLPPRMRRQDVEFGCFENKFSGGERVARFRLYHQESRSDHL
jgi:hypothetical protein